MIYRFRGNYLKSLFSFFDDLFFKNDKALFTESGSVESFPFCDKLLFSLFANFGFTGKTGFGGTAGLTVFLIGGSKFDSVLTVLKGSKLLLLLILDFSEETVFSEFDLLSCQ